MKYLKLVGYCLSISLLFSCTFKEPSTMKPFTEKEVLDEFDEAYNVTNPLSIYQSNNPIEFEVKKSKYSFFFNLELPYTSVAGSRIHLYADSVNWVAVLEVNGCNIKESYAETQLVYIGTGVDYINNKDELGNSNSNWDCILLSDINEIETITNKEGEGLETYQLMAKDVSSVKILGKQVHFKNDYRELEKVGIEVRDYENPKKLIDFEAFFRYIHETQPELLYVDESVIRKHFLKDIPKLIIIDKFHYTRNYTPNIHPSQQELFQLIAKILVTKDTTLWKPTLPPNNSWRNWESGNL